MDNQLLDQTTSSTFHMELSTTDGRSRIGSNTLPDLDGPCSSMGGRTGDSKSFCGEPIR